VLCGATATPIANSVAEGSIMQTYTQPDVLAGTGLEAFDAWAATFGQTVPAIELAPEGGSYRVTSRLARYRNVPELIAMFRRTADVRTSGDLTLTLPSLKDDRATVVVVPSSDGLAAYVKSLVARAEAIRTRAVEPDQDNMLKVTSDGRHAALDLRLVDEAPDLTGGKLEVAAQNIARIHHATRHLTYHDESGQPSPRLGGFQLVFCDLSTPKPDGSWSAYDELKGRLAAHGVPPSDVAFIHDARTDEARARLFARARSGQLAVLIGSTEKMGVGTNIHTRAAALHHIDCPWRPADIEQREGRVIRQGNQNTQVEIIRYATEGSFDVYMWLVDRTSGSTTGTPSATSIVRGGGLARRRSSAGSRIRGASIRRCVMLPPSRCSASARWSPTSTTCWRSGCRSRPMSGPSAPPTRFWPIWLARSLGRSRCAPTGTTSCGGSGSWPRWMCPSTWRCAATISISGAGCWRTARPAALAGRALIGERPAG
jgi:hypothetical protein